MIPPDMAKPIRVGVRDAVFHCRARGSVRQPIFGDGEDRERWLTLSRGRRVTAMHVLLNRRSRLLAHGGGLQRSEVGIHVQRRGTEALDRTAEGLARPAGRSQPIIGFRFGSDRLGGVLTFVAASDSW